MTQPTRCCALCGYPLMRRSHPFTDLRDLQCTTCGGYGVRAPDDEGSTLRAVLTTLCWWAMVIVAVMLVAWCMQPREASAELVGLPRYAVVKWERGVALMADFGVPQSERECKDFADRRNAAYAYAQVAARWTCVDLAVLGDKGA